MTRLPSENRDVVGIAYDALHPKYKVGPLCSVPMCSRIADHAHHIWRRSFLTGDYGWVKLWDGTVIQNLTGLCWQHHEDVTVNRTHVWWTGSCFTWNASGFSGALLDPQPLRLGQSSVTSDGPKEHEHGPGSVEKCPTCSRALPREKKPKPDEKRPREKWAITVPVDERENGADVLDVLLKECAVLFGHDEDAKAVRYFTVAQALALVVQHGAQMMGDA